MKLFTSLPARKDGTLIVRVGGTAYKFTGTPLSCDVEDEGHLEYLLAHDYMGEEEFEQEQKFLRQSALREARRAALDGKAPSSRGTFSPGVGPDDEDDPQDGGSGMPQESGSAPTGRVRKASRASNVTG
ncbi:hypothetical protein MI467_02555 [Delftia acidovorans]|uniref:hypothetical protein n=1 Tax=Delftia acidovorans TaxID=80866 RepID=UPI001EFC9BE8|nr:hypothetical protein [Delftia acidovorans]MCG8985719.1 hypothetical protein [Delftia acidovorans]